VRIRVVCVERSRWVRLGPFAACLFYPKPVWHIKAGKYSHSSASLWRVLKMWWAYRNKPTR
jgi:hypothetical protein